MARPPRDFDWNHARAFLATAEEGSFSAAARRLGLTQPTLGRQVDALERELGVTLFERVGRGLALTRAGIELLDHVRTMGVAANDVALAASGQSRSLEGTVSVTASEIIAAFLLPPILARLRVRHPGIQIRLIATNAIRDLRRREADIAVRSGRPTDPALVTTRLRDTPARLYAARAYLRKVGPIASKADLARAELIGFAEDERFLQGMIALGYPLTPKHFPFVSDSHLVQWELVKSGLGVGVVIDEVGDAEPLVERVLPDEPPIPVPTWLVCHREVHTSQRVRVVFDALLEALRAPAEGRAKPAPKSAARSR